MVYIVGGVELSSSCVSSDGENDCLIQNDDDDIAMMLQKCISCNSIGHGMTAVADGCIRVCMHVCLHKIEKENARISHQHFLHFQ